ncbi:hypothetical protein [Luteimicrobium subarcticum]|uniref:Uncharacterized protein n=1 Tax=Luteimicrobium subarcticum TaxID=620910 RepID=A0A2M8WW18_9MICO|nr:hypothetical protein [Luteimicrobium subarcticum]PJI95125.1 hypothetical protein CLV34_0979 [Luteimicrobium subarcticum]
MPSIFITESGTWYSTPGPSPRRGIAGMRAGVHLSGDLCSACLTETWRVHVPRVVFLCDDCRWLYARLLRDTGAPDVLGRSHDDARDRSVAHRSRRLREAFDRASAEGILLPAGAQADEPGPVPDRGDGRVLPRAVYDVYVAADWASRVRRFADWLAVLGPETAPVRAAALDDVPAWATALDDHHEVARAERVHADLKRALGDASRSIEQIRTMVDLAFAAERV